MNPEDIFRYRDEPIITPEERLLNNFMAYCRRFFKDNLIKDNDAISCFNNAARLFECEKKSAAEAALGEAIKRAKSLGIEVNNER